MSLQQEQEKCQYTFATVFEVTTSANKKKSSCVSDYIGQYNHSVRHNTNPQHNDILVPITRIHTASAQCQPAALNASVPVQTQLQQRVPTDLHRRYRRTQTGSAKQAHTSRSRSARKPLGATADTPCRLTYYDRGHHPSAQAQTAPTSHAGQLRSRWPHIYNLSRRCLHTQCQQALCLSRYREPPSHDSSMNRDDIKDSE